MSNEINGDGAGGAATARSRIRTGPMPDWASDHSFDRHFKSEREAQFTQLLFDNQIHAERRETYIHNVIRLETMEAVQHQSQWRLQFEPKTQMVTLHSLKVRRGEVEIDQLNLEKAHFLQREEGLERFVIHGWFTFLMILEDVRPGDVLDFSYTIETRPNHFPDNCAYFFSLPQGLSVGRYHFSVQFNAPRSLQWKSSAPELAPVESRVNETTSWTWSGEKYAGPKPEANTPSWHMAYSWMQISDFAGWPAIAEVMAKTWLTGENADLLAEIIQDIQSQEANLTAQIEKLIQLVQDDCRYLSVNLELGGYVPTAPAVVARRRFGDCKDLSFLLVNLLKKLGVSARPVLVNTFLRNSVAELLPMPSLFNHVVVEFEAEGKTRWVDTTQKDQGGGPFNRFIPHYAQGLPVDAAATGLIQPPPIPGQSNLFKIQENILLATNGKPSLLAVTFTAEGNQADLFRHQLKRMGVEAMAKQRLQAVTNRFGAGSRVGSMKHRDDRAANQIVLAELFEVSPALTPLPNSKLCKFHMPGNWVGGVLAKPEKGERRTPFLLPRGCQITYVLDVDSPALQQIKLNNPLNELNSPFVQFSRRDRTGTGYLAMDFSLTTHADSVPADQVEQHRELVEKIWQASARELTILTGYARSLQEKGFGELPSLPGKTPTGALIPPIPAIPDRPPQSASNPVAGRTSAQSSRRRQKPSQSILPRWLPYKRLIFLIIWLLFVWLILGRRHP